MNETVFGAINDLILPARRFLIVTHVAPDGDALGSLLAMGSLLQGQGKEVTLACEDRVPQIYRWLPGASEVIPRPVGAYDRVISLDCSDSRRMGKVYESRLASLPLLNIDHHVTNTEFGTLNWVDPSCVATAQMVLLLAEALGWEVTRPVATCLLTGLVTDTRSFRTPNVDAAALRAALRLMEAGASLSEVVWLALDQQPLSAVRVWAQAIDRLSVEDGILWTAITRAMRERWGVEEEAASGLANFLAGIRDAEVIVVFTERDNGTVDISMRAVPGLDVAQVALKLGGGGHPQAAGATLEGELAAVEEWALSQVRRLVAEQRLRPPDPKGDGGLEVRMAGANG